MGGEDDKHWHELEGQRKANEPRSREDSAGTLDDPVLHPNNEGHDAERLRDRLEDWAAQGDRGRSARALRRLDEQEAEANAAFVPGETEPPEAPAPPEGPRGTPHHANDHRKRIRGGESKKPARPPTATMPVPGRGAAPAAALPGEPPRVELGPDGEPEYVQGQERPRSSSRRR